MRATYDPTPGNLDQSKVEKSGMIFTMWEREPVLKVSWFAEDQIAFAIKRAELGIRDAFERADT